MYISSAAGGDMPLCLWCCFEAWGGGGEGGGREGGEGEGGGRERGEGEMWYVYHCLTNIR